MEEIFIVGVGMTRFGKHRDRSVKSLVAEAVGNALSDANAQQGDVGAAVFSNISQGIMEGQHAIRGQVALRSMGFSEIPIVNVENACAGGATALHQAAMMLRAGLTDVALAIGVEKMHSDDKLKSSAIFDGGWDVHDLDRSEEHTSELQSLMRISYAVFCLKKK